MLLPAIVLMTSVISGDPLLENERAAIEALRLVAEAQTRIRDLVAVDQDGDGLGEFGWFAELAGAVGLRQPDGSRGEVLDPPLLPPEFGRIDADGDATVRGYRFAMFLPDTWDKGLREAPGGGTPGGESPSISHVTWACYAWPERYGLSGERAFVINDDGMDKLGGVLETSNDFGPWTSYTGPVRRPFGDAAFDRANELSSNLVFGRSSARTGTGGCTRSTAVVFASPWCHASSTSRWSSS